MGEKYSRGNVTQSYAQLNYLDIAAEQREGKLGEE
jgi:hypothetical protein